MQIIEVTWGMAIKVWWSIVWRSVLIGFLAGLVVGVVMHLIGTVMGMDPELVQSIITLLSPILGLVIGVWAVKKVLYKRYANFSVVCIANQPVAPESHKA